MFAQATKTRVMRRTLARPAAGEGLRPHVGITYNRHEFVNNFWN
jgi:hypothetical protein